MSFLQTLTKIVKKNQSMVCVGLDSDATKLPHSVSHHKNPQFKFNKTIIERTHELVCAYKLNSAFYESEGIEGIQALHDTVHYINKNYSEIPVILDAKRADISNTNEGYIRFAFDFLGVQAITLHPYLGKESLLPFLNQKEKGLFILCKTSNPGSGEFQNLDCHGRPLFEIVAERVTRGWNEHGNCMLVVGATYPNELKRVREIVGEMTILVPGIGSQGGDLEATLRNGLNSKKSGLLIHSSRGIIFASHEADFAEVARKEVFMLRDSINTIISTI